MIAIGYMRRGNKQYMLEIIKLLIPLSDLNHRDNEGDDAMSMAMIVRSQDVIELLMYAKEYNQEYIEKLKNMLNYYRTDTRINLLNIFMSIAFKLQTRLSTRESLKQDMKDTKDPVFSTILQYV